MNDAVGMQWCRSKVHAIALWAVTLISAPGMAVAADPANPQSMEEKSTDERLQNQEQRIKDLEKRLQDMESAAMSGKPPTPAGASGAATVQPAADAPERIDVSAGQARDTHAVLTGADLASKDFPGSWPMFGTDYRMKIGGYLKADALYDLNGSGDKYQFLISQIPVNGQVYATDPPQPASGSYFNMFVKETRFNLDFRKTKPGEPAQQVFIEMDFFDESSFSPRLRQAYVVYGNLLVGLTWSTLTETKALPYIIDFAYGDAIFGGRTTQIRWQQQASEHWSWAAALEMLNSSGIDNPSGAPGVASPNLPVMAGRVTYEDSNTLVMLGVAVDQLRWDGEGSGPNATANAWAVVTNGRQNIGDRDYVTWNLSYGNGSAENISALSGSNANATLFPSGYLETNRSYNLALGYVHKFNDRFTTNLAYAVTRLQNDLRAPDSIEGGWVAHANLIWKLSKAASTGIEYMWGQRENTNGEKGDAARLQTMFQYFF
jgi:hypothetical protein